MQRSAPVDRGAFPKQEIWLKNRSVKSWSSWTETLGDHRTIASNLARLLGAYVGPNMLPPDMIESIMLTVNSVNMCTFCAGLHCDLGRIAGLKEPHKINQAKSSDEIVELCPSGHGAAVRYARIFAMTDGRGKMESGAFDALVLACGDPMAGSVRALCWFLYWGSFTGNTLSCAIGHKVPKPGTSTSFLGQFLAYYSLLFYGVVTVVSVVLKVLPRLPDFCLRAFGAFNTVLCGIFIGILGLIGCAVGAEGAVQHAPSKPSRGRKSE
jgi:hypothetical protein